MIVNSVNRVNHLHLLGNLLDSLFILFIYLRQHVQVERLMISSKAHTVFLKQIFAVRFGSKFKLPFQSFLFGNISQLAATFDAQANPKAD